MSPSTPDVDALATLFGTTPSAQLDRVQVALILGLSKARVRQLELTALAKLRRHPAVVAMAREWGIRTEGSQ